METSRIKIKNLLRRLLPPFAVELLRPSPKYGFFGPYKTWQEAQAHSKGYDDAAILVKVKDSLLKVKNGQAAYERDSVLFDHIEYSEHVLAELIRIAGVN